MDERTEKLSRSELQRRAVQGVGWTVIHTVVSIPIAFVVNLVVARLLGVVDYGRLAYLSVVMDVAGTILSLGVGTALVQFGSRLTAQGRRDEAGRLLSISQGFSLVFIAPAITIVILIMVHVPPLLLGLAVVFGVVLPNLFGTASTALAMENRTAASARNAMVQNIVLQLAVVATVLTLRDADSVWAARVAAGGIIAGLALIPLSPDFRRAVLHPRWPRAFPAGFWKFAIPSGLSTLIAQLVVTRSEVVFLDWLSTPQAVGIFALAMGVAGNIFAPAQAITGPLIPALSSLRATADEDAMVRAFARTVRASSTVSALITAAGVPTIAVLIPLLYGHAFSAAVLPVLALGCVGGFTVAASPVWAFTLARLSARRLLTINIIALAVDVALAWTLIAAIGTWGAVIANGASVTVRVVMLLHGEGRALGIRQRDVARMFAPVLVGMAAAWAGWGVATAAPVGPLLGAVIAAALGLGIAIVGLRLLSLGLGSSDAAAIVDAAPGPTRRVLRPVLAVLTR
jgi:O-antigen/teichoic acid export membrane protein